MTTFAFSSLYKLLFTQDILRYSPEAERKLFIILPCYCEIIFKKCQNYTQRIRVISCRSVLFIVIEEEKKYHFRHKRAAASRHFLFIPISEGLLVAPVSFWRGPLIIGTKLTGICVAYMCEYGEREK